MQKKSVLAEWEFQNKNYFISLKKAKKTENSFSFLLEDFFKEICEHNPSILISIRDGKILYDKLKIVSVVKNNLKKGALVGTKENLLVKLEKIDSELIKCNKIKIQVLSNLYNSLVDSCQALFIINNFSPPVPKKIPEELKNKFSKKIDKKIINYPEEIIRYYKDVEHQKVHIIDGKKLDDLAKKLLLFKEILKDL